MYESKKQYQYGTGRRKSSVARVRLIPGSGKITINGRDIDDAHFFIQKDIWGEDILVFQIEANAFLWKMVRTLTGTLINLDKTNAPEDSMKKILEAKDRTKAGVTAPPTGLFLYQIKFDGIRRHV